MRYEDLYIDACAAWLPPAMSVQRALEQGLCEQSLATALDVASVRVSEGESGPEMAAAAARTALQRSGHGPEEIDLILHACLYNQGHELWAPASYVQREAVGNECPALQVGQVSNGGLGALEMAASYLLADDRRTAALLTTGDRFCPPGFDRWRSDPGTVYADGGSALVLSRDRGFARLDALVTVSRPGVEGMHRGSAPFAEAPLANRGRVDLAACKDEFVADVGRSFAVSHIAQGQQEALKRTLAEAGLELNDIDRFVLPHLGRRRLDAGYFRRFDLAPGDTTWPWSRTVGHLGAGDQFAGLEYLVTGGRAAVGDRCLLAAVGAGFTWSCAVIEILELPGWEACSAQPNPDRGPVPSEAAD